jgi:hypothetical protein
VLSGKFCKGKGHKTSKEFKGEFNWKFLYLICAFALIKDAFRDFLDALF